jgi:hypothetical protein
MSAIGAMPGSRRIVMQRFIRRLSVTTAAAALVGALAMAPAPTQETNPTYRDIATTLGSVPIRETVAMAAITRHWSTVLNGMQTDLSSFRQETDTVLHLAAERASTAAKQ